MNYTIHDVAKRAGVSISTVSRVLNSNAGVKDSKMAAVLESIEYYKYEPNQFGRGLVKQTSRTVGVYFSDFTGLNNTYTLELLQGITQLITENDYNLLLITQKPNSALPNYYDFLKRKKVDGLIAIEHKQDDFIYPYINTFTIPVYDMGYHAADMLLKHLNGINTEKTYMVPYYYTDRGSIKQI